MRVLFTAAVSLFALAACGPTAPAAPTAEEVAKTSAELTAWFDAEYEEELQMSPIGLTFQGRKDQYDKLDDYSNAAIDRKLEWRRASVAEMKAKFDPAKLDAESRTSFDMWALQAEMDDKLAPFRRQGYVFVKDGPHASLANFLITFHEVSEKSDMEAYIKRLSEVARALDQSLDQAKLVLVVAEQHQVFAHDADRQRIAARRNLFHRRDRLPIAAQKFAARRTGAGARQQIVLRLGQHDESLSLYSPARCRRSPRYSAGISSGARVSFDDLVR